MILYLVRHGDALPDESMADTQRRLSSLGQRQAAVAARFLQNLQPSLDLILSSPFLRARETALAFGQVYRKTKLQTSEQLVPTAHPAQMMAYLQTQPLQSVLLVGHEPYMSEAIAYLISGKTHTNIEMRKGSMACVAISSLSKEGSGVLSWLVSYELMENVMKE
jgi:phosphohistidine phosphatase